MRFVRLLILILLSTSCNVKYSLTGASISPEPKTFQVNYFQNNAPLIEPIPPITITTNAKIKIGSPIPTSTD